MANEASGFLGSLVDGVFGFASNAQQNHYNMEIAKYQNEFNEKMWHMQNEYNSPIQTMQRLTDAGINPRAYQQLGQFANAQSPKQAAEMSKISELSAFQQVAQNAITNNLLLEQANTEKSKQSVNESQALLNDSLAGKANSEVGVNQARLNEINANIERIRVERDLSLAQKNSIVNDMYGSMLRTIVYGWANGIDATMFNFPVFGEGGRAWNDFIREEPGVKRYLQFNERMDAEQRYVVANSWVRWFEHQSIDYKYNYMKNHGYQIVDHFDNLRLNLDKEKFEHSSLFDWVNYGTQTGFDIVGAILSKGGTLGGRKLNPADIYQYRNYNIYNR